MSTPIKYPTMSWRGSSDPDTPSGTVVFRLDGTKAKSIELTLPKFEEAFRLHLFLEDVYSEGIKFGKASLKRDISERIKDVLYG